jgi:hypothetical protein
MNRADAPYLPLTPEVVDAHLRGEAHIGLYPLNDDDTCWWVAADFDKEAAMLDALAYIKAARSFGIPAALEVSQSGRGAHVWIFFAHAISASVARSIGTSLLSEAIRLRGSMHLSSYDRLFPSQDVHTGRGVGNLIAAPMNGKRRQHGTTVFLDPATLEPYEDQWAYLSSIARLSTKDVTALARQLPDPQIGHNVRRLQLPTSWRGTVFGCWPRGLGYGYITVFEPTTTSGVHRGSSDMHAAKPSTLPSFCKGRARHPARDSYDSRVRNLRTVALFAATGASVALIGAPIAAADNGPGQPQCSGPPGACPTYGNAPINNSPPTRPPAFFVPYDGARYPYGN